MEKIGRNVKHSFIGPLPGGKGIKGPSQNGWLRRAPEHFGRFGPELFSPLRYPHEF